MISPSDRCYRHPDRPASVGCQRCGRPICREDMRSASVGFHCPECAQSGKQKVIKGIPSARSTSTITMILIAANVLVFLAQQVLDGRSELVAGPTNEGLLYGPFVDAGGYYRILTAGFLHDGFIHLGFNMYILYLIGPYVERLVGGVRFALFYLFALFGGSAAVLWFAWDQSTLGASGAVLGLAGVLAGQQLAAGRPLTQIPALNMILLNLALPLLIGGISFWGHFGGVAAGMACGAAVHKLHGIPSVSRGVESALYAAGVIAMFALAVAGGLAGGV